MFYFFSRQIATFVLVSLFDPDNFHEKNVKIKILILHSHIRCQCNGHATHCIESNEQEGIFNTTMLCLCQHNTAGPNCETCMDNSWDRKWDRATARDANECKRKFLFFADPKFHLLPLCQLCCCCCCPPRF